MLKDGSTTTLEARQNNTKSKLLEVTELPHLGGEFQIFKAEKKKLCDYRFKKKKKKGAENNYSTQFVVLRNICTGEIPIFVCNALLSKG